MGCQSFQGKCRSFPALLELPCGAWAKTQSNFTLLDQSEHAFPLSADQHISCWHQHTPSIRKGRGFVGREVLKHDGCLASTQQDVFTIKMDMYHFLSKCGFFLLQGRRNRLRKKIKTLYAFYCISSPYVLYWLLSPEVLKRKVVKTISKKSKSTQNTHKHKQLCCIYTNLCMA